MTRHHGSDIALPGNRWDLLNGKTPGNPPTVSVVVVHYRQQRELDRTLRALLTQDYGAERIEIIVVDDGSPEAPNVPAGVTLIVQEDRGFRLAAARNRGAAAAHNDILCFLDADTTPERGYVRELTRLPALAPDCVTVGRRRHSALSGTPPESPVEVEGPRYELEDPAWLRDGYRASRNLLDADDRSYRLIIGAVTACRREFFGVVGGYDENFVEYGGEDWEWAYRAWLAGAVFAHVPGAIAWHDGPEWSDRAVLGRQAAKNAEALRLADLIPILGSRGYGVRPRHADILLEPAADGWSSAARFLCLDSALADVPEAQIREPSDGTDRAADPLLDRVRIRIEIHRPVRVTHGALRGAVDRVSAEQLGRLLIIDETGRPLVTVFSTRATSRQDRWKDDTLFEAIVDQNAGFLPIDSEPDLEGYLGGWG